ncbi:MAG: S1 RNA-binding domain-containing protein [Deltaproteobacteria bacterium]|nr:S1 RNA-binding domain-containing protein [Deltaproteobacteria bacterium]
MTDFQREAEERLTAEPLVQGQVVEALVTGVDDTEKMVTLQIGNQKARLPLREMTWARKPNHKVPYYAAKVTKPSTVLKKHDVILVRLLKTFRETPKVQKRKRPPSRRNKDR